MVNDKYTDELEVTVRSLPPLQLHVTLPERYPLNEAPIVEELRERTGWLSDAQVRDQSASWLGLCRRVFIAMLHVDVHAWMPLGCRLLEGKRLRFNTAPCSRCYVPVKAFDYRSRIVAVKALVRLIAGVSALVLVGICC